MAKTIQVTIPEEAWENDGDADSARDRLLAQITINGVHFHLGAIAVEERDWVQHACCAEDEPTLNALSETSGDGAFDTMEIRGREYVVFAIPHC